MDPTVVAGESKPDLDIFRLSGTRLEGKYDVAEAVAEGGFAVVYRGTHRTLEKAVAIKVLKVPGDLSPEMRGRFLEKFAQEARVIAHLEHPAIVRVIDFGASPMPHGEAAPWMVLEWLPGTTLEEEMASGALQVPLSPREAYALLRPVFDALAHAHEEGIAHRDIKPSNMMRTRTRRGETSLRLMDFGIAKRMHAEERSTTGRTATATALVAFSLHYAASEQISGTRTGPWTDVHALGLVLTELLTGRAAYSGADANELYVQVLSPLRPTPARVGIDVGAWEPILARALALRPAERWSDAHALREALEAALSETTSIAPERTDAAIERPPRTTPTTLRASAVQTVLKARSSRRSHAAVLTLAIGVGAFAVGGGWWLESIGKPQSVHASRLRATEPVSRAASPPAPPLGTPLLPPPPPPTIARVVDAIDGGTPLHSPPRAPQPLRLIPRHASTSGPPPVPPVPSPTLPASSGGQARQTTPHPTADEHLPAE